MLLKHLLKFTVVLSALLALNFVLVSCGNDDEKETTQAPILSTTEAETTAATQSETTDVAQEVNGEKKNEDEVDDGSVEIDTYVILNNESTTIKGNGASFENGVLTIMESGTYSLQGTLSNGKIYINSSDEDKKVKLVLNGVSVSCSTDAPLFVENSPEETILILADGTVNTFSDTSREIPSDETVDYATATIYSKDDLQIEGTGTLNINANFNKGIFSKNDIDIKGGTINITSVDDGIRGKQSVEIEDGTINITSGGDGIRTNETTQEGKGNIRISDGIISIYSDLDCIQSVVDINITGGTFNLVSNGGSTGVSSSKDDMFRMNGEKGDKGNRYGENKHDEPSMFDFLDLPGKSQYPESSFYESLPETDSSYKGIKADGKITVNGGSFNISTTDDCIHAVNLDILGGNFSLASDDDGIHADSTVNVQDANVNISYSFEGVEGTVINILSGKIQVVASDDGFNAAGNSSSSTNGGMGNRGGMGGGGTDTDRNCVINLSGGYVFINASGDGVDSNGNVNQSGGTLIVFGPTSNGNGALDYGGTYIISGGTLLATGSPGMAQSVSGDGIDVFAFSYFCQSDVLNAILDKNGHSLIGFNSPKNFGFVVFASDRVEDGEKYNLYSGGSYNSSGEDGVYLDGEYAPGSFVRMLSAS